MKITRRKSIKTIGSGLAITGALGLSGSMISCSNKDASKAKAMVESNVVKKPFFDISLAQWSLHKSFFGDSLSGGFGPFVQALQTDPDSLLRGTLNPIDFPEIAKTEYGVDAVEFVNTFYFSKARDKAYMKDLKDRCDSNGVKAVLIMCDALGDLGETDDKKRNEAVANHHQWVDAAKYLGCHAIRVNAAGSGTAEEVKSAAVQGLGKLTEYGKENDINIIVENHGGFSSDGSWLASVMAQVDSPFCGTLPDFGNFCMERDEDYSCKVEYDKYKGVAELMPYAKGVSAKTHDFDENGDEVGIDYRRMLQIVKDAGFTGYIDIEYEGQTLSEPEGIKATKALLERIGAELA